MLRKALLGVVLGVVVSGITLSAVLVSAEENFNIPVWIKNNAGWWSEDAISDGDYVSGLQYLISQGIIKIPIKQVIATDTAISEEIQAHSFVVRVKFNEGEQSFYSFQRIIEYEGVISAGAPRLQLEGLPSLDKSRLYDFVEETIGGSTLSGLENDFLIDIFSKDGSLISTLEYRKCQVTDYWVYVNDDEDKYRFGKTDGPEIREVFNLVCKGYDIEAP